MKETNVDLLYNLSRNRLFLYDIYQNLRRTLGVTLIFRGSRTTYNVIIQAAVIISIEMQNLTQGSVDSK